MPRRSRTHSDRYRRDLNVLVSRGVQRMYRIAETEYRRTLDAHAVLDFADLLQRTLNLLRQMGEFAQSRYRLESRYHHVLVDEFQDTSRAQWELVSLLVQSWGEELASLLPVRFRPQSSSSAIANSRSTRSATRTCRFSTTRGGISKRCGPKGTPPHYFAELQISSGAARVCERCGARWSRS
jgi:superfamily I DNA/RNA helicase